MSERVLTVLYPGCVPFEVALALELLRDECVLETCAPAGVARIEAGGLSIAPTHAYPDVQGDAYAAVLVPGGDPADVMRDPSLDRILADADGRGRLLAAICGGVLVLAKAGVLRGRAVTHTYTTDYGPRELVHATERFFRDCAYQTEPMVQDDHVLTARPDAYVEFAISIATQLGVLDPPRARTLTRYYRGRS